MISQNANAYTDGLGPGVAALADWWADRQAGQSAIDGLVSLQGAKTQWLAGARDPEHIDPGQYLADQAVLDLPGRAQYVKDLLWDYQFTVPRYQEFHAWLRQRAPKVLAIWGRHDPFFTPAGAHAYRTDVPDAEVVLLDTGHFALEEEADTIATTVDVFLAKAPRPRQPAPTAVLTRHRPGAGQAPSPLPTNSRDHKETSMTTTASSSADPAISAVHAFYAALGSGDIPAALARLGDTVTWHEAPGMPYQGT